jgi:hypothetical protein
MGSGRSKVAPVCNRTSRSEEAELSALRMKYVEVFMKSVFNSQNQAFDSEIIWSIIESDLSRYLFCLFENVRRASNFIVFKKELFHSFIYMLIF